MNSHLGQVIGLHPVNPSETNYFVTIYDAHCEKEYVATVSAERVNIEHIDVLPGTPRLEDRVVMRGKMVRFTVDEEGHSIDID